MRIRRSKVLSLMLEDFSQTEISKKLDVSQPTVSRDMRALDVENAELSRSVMDMELRFNLTWQAYQEIDASLKHALDNYQRLDPSNVKDRLDALRLIMGLVGRKIFLLTYMGFDPHDDHKDDMKHRFGVLKKMLEDFANQLGLKIPESTPGVAVQGG